MAAFRPSPGILLDPLMDAETACELLGVTVEDVLNELNARRQVKVAKMRREMALAQKAGGERRVLRRGGMDARVDMMIHPLSYHYWGQRLGYACWDEEGSRESFVDQYKRDNPEARVKLRRAATVSFAGCNNPRLFVSGQPRTREDRLALNAG